MKLTSLSDDLIKLPMVQSPVLINTPVRDITNCFVYVLAVRSVVLSALKDLVLVTNALLL